MFMVVLVATTRLYSELYITGTTGHFIEFN